MSKIFIAFILILFCCLGSTTNAQGIQLSPQNTGFNLDYLIGTYGVGTAASTGNFGQAALIDSQGNFLLKQSQANMNNQIAYEHSLRNDSLKTETYFGKRQTNGFYRHLEEWQSKTKVKLKREHGELTREDIRYLYGR
jgi:hypothetical protein